jgi:hypothetical protein
MIPPVYDCQGGTKRLVHVMPGVSLFKLVVPPLARRGGIISGVECLVPNRLPLEAIRLYPYLLGCNRWPVVPKVKNTDNLVSQISYFTICAFQSTLKT